VAYREGVSLNAHVGSASASFAEAMLQVPMSAVNMSEVFMAKPRTMLNEGCEFMLTPE
jgi:hypothetical protein